MEAKLALSNLERQEQLVQFVEKRGRATVVEISDHFTVSVATARRDLETLETQGRLQRFHGGAKPSRKAPPEPPIQHRAAEQAGDKQRIGRAAAALIEDGDTVFLGSGTTVLEVAKCLHHRENLTVITNSLLVLNELSVAPDITVVGLGGMLRHSELSLIGHITEQALTEVRARKIIIGIHAIDIKHGLTNDYLPETKTDRAILAQRGEVIIVADHTKCTRVSTAFLAPVTAIQKFVSDVHALPDFITDLKAKGVQVILV
ncbi:MAG: DeoR/GlpR transcriptional regulator [Chloroflexi bacterium]|nr:DeoR/GlpR transcriptional regulator [Chloroflexota bacterium]